MLTFCTTYKLAGGQPRLDPTMSQTNEAQRFHTNDNQARTQNQNQQYPLQTDQSQLAQANN